MPADDLLIDARGQRCPLPVLRAEKAFDNLAAGRRLVVLADDPVARIDIPLMARKRGAACEVAPQDGGWRFTIAKGKAQFVP